MQSRDFCFWLQGFFEITGATHGIDSNQLSTIRNHLNLVFKHEIDPSMGGPVHQKDLNKVHSPNIIDSSKIMIRC